MAEIVLALAASHAPGLTGWFDKAPAAMRENVQRAYDELGRLIKEANIDVLIGVANDHLANFKVDHYPDFTVGLAPEHSGPAEWFRPWLNLKEDYTMPGHPEVAGLIYNGFVKRNVKATAKFDNLNFDDNYSVPMTATGFTKMGIPLVPILQNCTVPPVPDQYASYKVGQALGDTIRNDLPADMRVGLFATGGLSHEPGGPKYFAVDEKFDRWFLDLLVEGDHEKVLREATYEKMEEAGAGGTAELLSWIVVMGAIGERPCHVHCYEPVVEWRCGMGAVHWDMAAVAAAK